MTAASVVARLNNNTVAAFSCVAVTVGLVAVPPELGAVGVARAETAMVSLRASVATIGNALSDSLGVPTSVPASAVGGAIADRDGTTAHSLANAETGATNALQNLVIGALAVAATPLWYLGFPVTLPLSIVGGILYTQIASIWITATGGRVEPISLALLGAAIGLGLFAAGPLAFGLTAISSAFTPTNSAASTFAAVTTAKAATATTASGTTAEGEVRKSLPSEGKPSPQTGQAKMRSGTPSTASATTAVTTTESEPNTTDAPVAASIPDPAQQTTTAPKASTRRFSKSGDEKDSDRLRGKHDRKGR